MLFQANLSLPSDAINSILLMHLKANEIPSWICEFLPYDGKNPPLPHILNHSLHSNEPLLDVNRFRNVQHMNQVNLYRKALHLYSNVDPSTNPYFNANSCIDLLKHLHEKNMFLFENDSHLKSFKEINFDHTYLVSTIKKMIEI